MERPTGDVTLPTDVVTPVRASAAPELLEREDERAALAALVSGLREGTGGAVLLQGQPGIGKTSLLEAALELEAVAGAQVLRARGSELESGLAFGAVRQLLAPPVMRLREEERAALLRGPAALAAPVLGIAGDASPPTTLTDPLYGVYWLLAGLAERRPVVLAIDDLHWLDPESARFVAYLLARLDGLSVLVMAAARAPEPGVDDYMAAVQEAFPTIIRPEPLSVEAVGRLLADRPEELVHRLTGGNPLLVLELARSLAAAPAEAQLEQLGSATVGRLVLDRVNKVSQKASALARAVSLFADGAELGDAAAVAELDETTASEAADELVSIQVLRQSDRLRFLHPIMRAAVYQELGPFERRRGHARAARRLQGFAGPIEEVAAHLLASSPAGDGENVRILRAAADDAMARVAPRAAVRYLQRAVAEGAAAGDDLRMMLLRLGRVQRLIGLSDAQETFKQAVEQSAQAPHRIEAAIELASTALEQSDLATAKAAIRAVDGVEAGFDDRLLLDMLLAEILWYEGDLDACMDLTARVPPDQAGNSAAQRFALVQAAAMKLLLGEPNIEVLRMLRLATRDGEAAGVADLDFGDPVQWLIDCDALEEAEALAAQRLEHARRTGNEALYANTHLSMAFLSIARGDLADAEDSLRMTVEHPACARHTRDWAMTTLVQLRIARGQIEEAERDLDQFHPYEALEDALTLWRAEIAFERNDLDRALGLYERFREQRARIRHPAGYLWTPNYLQCLAALGRAQEAIAMAHDLVRRSEETGSQIGLGVHLGSLARLTGGLDDLRRAREFLDSTPYRWHAARTELDLGAALRRGGHRVEAREHLRAALDYAAREKVLHFTERAREELRLAGARPRRTSLSGVDALTPAEARIARLVSEGRSNRQIAQHLFLTVKTVEATLTRAYRKLDVTSRQELAQALDGATALVRG